MVVQHKALEQKLNTDAPMDTGTTMVVPFLVGAQLRAPHNAGRTALHNGNSEMTWGKHQPEGCRPKGLSRLCDGSVEKQGSQHEHVPLFASSASLCSTWVQSYGVHCDSILPKKKKKLAKCREWHFKHGGWYKKEDTNITLLVALGSIFNCQDIAPF